MNVLIACECSQTVCAEFRKLGANAYSCDLEKEYGEHPEWHIQYDVLKVLYGNCTFFTNDGKKHHVKKWDLVIAHPPCTYLSRAQNGLYNEKRLGVDYVENRKKTARESSRFFYEIHEFKCTYTDRKSDRLHEFSLSKGRSNN